MSREIKFRAWYIPFGSKGSMQEMVHGKASSILALAEMSPDEYIVEQFTGLKDKDGKDIYEGDIVQYGNEEDMKFSVTFKYGIFYACNTLGSEFMVDTFLGSLAIGNRLKVIGNAHQNSEFLRQTNEQRN